MGTLLLYSFGINGIIYVHQLRICHFLQGIWLIGHVFSIAKLIYKPHEYYS